jgi:hypothetical protein
MAHLARAKDLAVQEHVLSDVQGRDQGEILKHGFDAHGSSL